MNDLIALRDAIRAYLKAHPHSQVRIAQQIGASQTWVGKFMRGEIGSPRLERLVRLQQWINEDKKNAKTRQVA